MNNSRIFLLLLLTLFVFNARNGVTQNSQKLPLEAIAKYDVDVNSYQFKSSVNMNAETFVKEYTAELGLTAGNKVVLKSKSSDKHGLTHYRYQQYYQDLLVEGGQLLLHERNGKLISMQSQLAKNLAMDVSERVHPTAALRKISDSLGIPINLLIGKENKIEPYLWKVQYPEPKITFAYKVHLEEGFKSPLTVILDGRKGDILFAKRSGWPFTDQCSTGTAYTLFDGEKTVDAARPTPPNFLSGCGDIIVQRADTSLVNGAPNAAAFNQGFFNDGDNVWGDQGGDNQTAGTAMWAATQVHDYFLSDFNRRGYNDDHHEVFVQLKATTDEYGHENNAKEYSLFRYTHGTDFYEILLGDGNQGLTDNPYVTVDIIGHEFTHGLLVPIISETITGEQISTVEGLCDIFGTMCEFYSRNGNGNWDIGESIWLENIQSGETHGRVRALDYPIKSNCPDTRKGPRFQAFGIGDADHMNSTIVSHCFYLLSEGGSGVNGIGNRYAVEGIGKDDAANIFYTAMMYYFQTNSPDYAELRNATMVAAEDIYGNACSNEKIQLGHAWYAVNVLGFNAGEENSNREICGTFVSTDNNTPLNNPRVLHVLKAGDCSTGSTNLCTISSGAVVNFKAGEEIRLKNWFSAKPGCEFNASIDQCGILVNQDAFKQSNPSAAEKVKIGQAVKLDINPNPARSVITLTYSIPEDGEVHLGIYDLLGKQTGEILASAQAKGSYRSAYPISSLQPGVYYVVLQTRYGRVSKRINIIK